MPLGEEIHQTISAGTYSCVVCFDNICRESRVWHCSKCFHVYHYHCLLGWAGESPNSSDYRSPITFLGWWKCPTCAESYTGLPKRSCWCGDSQTPPPNIAGLPPFSCGQPCGQRMDCEHYCYETCHAGSHGPCREQHVVNSCFCGTMKARVRCGNEPSLICCGLSTCNPEIVSPPSQPVHLMVNVMPQAPTMPRGVENYYTQPLERTNRGRPHRASNVLRALDGIGISTKLVFSIIFTLALIVTIYGYALVKLKPYNHRYIAEHAFASIAAWVGILFLSYVTVPINAASTICWNTLAMYLMTKFKNNLLRVPYSLKTIVNVIYVLFVMVLGCTFVCAVIIWILGPVVIPYVLPGLVRQQAFAHICDGFDTQVLIDGDNHMYPLFRNLDQSGSAPLPDYAMAITHATLTLDTYETSGHNNTIVTAYLGFDRIDYDFDNRIWYTTLDDVQIANGTFIFYNHLVFPSLGLQVPNFKDYLRKCVYEPYLKMHRGSGDIHEIEQQAKEAFTDDYGDLVLRTTSFGWVQGELQICAKRGDVVGNDGKVELRGLGRDVPVVAGLVAVVRQKGTVQGSKGRGKC